MHTQKSDIGGEGGLASARAVFAGESLPMPFVPAALAAAVRSRGAWVFGTREVSTGVYTLAHYVSELASPELEDYLLMGFDGHGMASQAAHYYLVCGPLALFIQRSHGNPYVDEGLSRRRIEGALGLAESLYRDLVAAEAAGKLPPGKRLVVVESDFLAARWGWVARGEPPMLEDSVNALLEGLFSVREMLD